MKTLLDTVLNESIGIDIVLKDYKKYYKKLIERATGSNRNDYALLAGSLKATRDAIEVNRIASISGMDLIQFEDQTYRADDNYRRMHRLLAHMDTLHNAITTLVKYPEFGELVAKHLGTELAKKAKFGISVDDYNFVKLHIDDLTLKNTANLSQMDVGVALNKSKNWDKVKISQYFSDDKRVVFNAVFTFDSMRLY